jgi:2-oxo-4-hydroxy-4-carboxy-5-ureidoimidazoline decarboxylase
MADAADPALRINALRSEEARTLLARCCGSRRWVEAMLAKRPFPSARALFSAANRESASLSRADLLEAFAEHPEIGANLAELRQKYASTASLSTAEQARVASADEETLLRLRAGNQAYKQRFGYLFIVCASGKSASEMLELLEARLANDPETELAVAAVEQAKIALLRLEQLLT